MYPTIKDFKMNRKQLDISAGVFLGLVLMFVITPRVLGTNMTEGEILTEFWYWWVAAMLSAVAACFCFFYPTKR